MNRAIPAKKLFFSALCVISLFLILPQYGGIALMGGSASILLACVAASPQSFRSRSGSLVTAFCLVAAMWVAAVFITVMTLMGEIQG